MDRILVLILLAVGAVLVFAPWSGGSSPSEADGAGQKKPRQESPRGGTEKAGDTDKPGDTKEPSGTKESSGTKKPAESKKDTESKKVDSAKKPDTAKPGQTAEKTEDVVQGVRTTELRKKEKSELPVGNDPEDIRAMRGAQAMLDVERKLQLVLSRMKIEGKSKFLPFDELDDWPYEDGFIGMPKRLRVWHEKRVSMAGFMLPIDTVENIKEFYLVKSLWSCCYGVPPDVNGLVKVRLKTKKGIDFHYDPILLVGKFRIEKEMDEDYCVAIYQLDAEVAKAIDVESLRDEKPKPEVRKPAPKEDPTPRK